MRIHPFDFPLASGGAVGGTILKPILEQKITPIVVDVGARNGMMLLPGSYAQHCRNVGFEPNPVEYEKLVQGTTDAARHGYAPPAFKETTYFDCAVWNQEERRSLYVTVGPGATTMMGSTDHRVTSRMFLGGTSPVSYEAEHTAVTKTEEVACRPLDNILDGETIDFLKIDAEGAELRILQGAKNLLSQQNVLFIKSEFMFLPYYEEHPLLGHQHVYLADLGYRLIDLDLAHGGYTRNQSRIGDDADCRIKYGGDAYFIPDPDRCDLDAMDRQRMAAIALTLGYHSLAVSLLHDAALLTDREISEIETAVSQVPAGKKMRLMWNRVPYAVWAGLKRVGIGR